MNTLPVLLGALCVYALAYRYYSAFIAAKALALDDRRITPAHTYEDGHNYVASPKWVLFGHHFAAIAGAGPLVGPTLAAQFGFAPGFLWLLIGAVLAGCVQDFTVLVASVRHRGRSLADIARTEISPFAGLVAMIAVLFILLVTLAGLGIVVVNALAEQPVGRLHHRHDHPHRRRHGAVDVQEPRREDYGHRAQYLRRRLSDRRRDRQDTGWLRASRSGAHFHAPPDHAPDGTMALVASVLPVWLLLEPRDYLSTYVKLGTIAVLILGVFVVHPDIQFPERHAVHSRRRADHQGHLCSRFCS